jgi:hypothetical protein
MKLNASIATIRPNTRNLRVSPPRAPEFRRNKLDSVFHVLLLAIGFALTVDAAVQSALDVALFAGNRTQLAAKAPRPAANVAGRAAAMAVNRDTAPRAHVKS